MMKVITRQAPVIALVHAAKWLDSIRANPAMGEKYNYWSVHEYLSPRKDGKLIGEGRPRA